MTYGQVTREGILPTQGKTIIFVPYITYTENE